jgi:hypothetical protein
MRLFGTRPGSYEVTPDGPDAPGGDAHRGIGHSRSWAAKNRCLRQRIAAVLCYASANRTRRVVGISHWTAGVDTEVLELLRGPFQFPWIIGPTVEFIGSPSTPVLGDVWLAEANLRASAPKLYEQIVQGRFDTNIRLPGVLLPAANHLDHTSD